MESGLRGPSRTALMAAMGRALHREGPPPHIFDDWLAADLAGPDGQAIAATMRVRAAPEQLYAFQAWTAARSRFVEDFVAQAADVSSTAAQLGEPFISPLRRDEVERLLLDHGFDAVSHFGAPDASRDYLGRADIGIPDVQRLATAVVR